MQAAELCHDMASNSPSHSLVNNDFRFQCGMSQMALNLSLVPQDTCTIHVLCMRAMISCDAYCKHASMIGIADGIVRSA